MRERFVREPQQPGTAVMQIKTKQGVGKDPLVRLFVMLWDPDQVFLTPTSQPRRGVTAMYRPRPWSESQNDVLRCR
jgi:hypothetical protein